MNKRIFLTVLWIAVLVLGGLTPATAQAPAGIMGVNPGEGTVGTQVTVSGAGFGEKQGEVLIGEEKCKVLAWSDSQITCEVHKPQAPGDYALTVLRQGDRQPAEPLTFSCFTMRRPEIFPGELAQDGVTVTVLGAFFGDKKGELRVGYLEGGEVVITDPKIVDWDMNVIRFEIPAGLVGKFVLKVANEVGAGFALLDLGDGPPLLTAMPSPLGWGGGEARNNGSGVWYKGNFYVFYLNDPFFDFQHAIVQCQIFKPATGSFEPCPGTLPAMATDAIPVSLVVGDELWLFHVTGSNTILFSRYNGSEWLSIPWEGTVSKTPKILWYTTDSQKFHPAVVYNPATGRVTMYHTYGTYIVWSYTDDGETWHHGGNVSPNPYSDGGLSAVYREGAINGQPYDTLLLFHDNVGQKFVFYIKDGVRVGYWMTTEGQSHTLVDLDDDPSGEIAMIFYRHEVGGLKAVYVRKLDRTGAWQTPELAYHLPLLPIEVGWYVFDDIDFTGAISLWPDGTRHLMLFYCYIFIDMIEPATDGPYFRMADTGIW